jgi:hypothetical protein
MKNPFKKLQVLFFLGVTLFNNKCIQDRFPEFGKYIPHPTWKSFSDELKHLHDTLKLVRWKLRSGSVTHIEDEIESLQKAIDAL